MRGETGRTAFLFSLLTLAAVVLLPVDGLAESSDDSDAIEELIVTGSRIKRDTYQSVAPLQIINASVSRESGLVGPATILQESTAAAGIQVDATQHGFINANGPGASNIDLRGLGVDRTLVLVDGRRVAPAGVEGAPAAADLNLVPGLLVSRYEVLLDGASSIYGSDALAGVVNILLRTDLDGLELEAYTRSPQQSGGLEHALSAAWGKTFSQGLLGVGLEYVVKDPVTYDQRRWTAECERHVEIDENGVVRTTNLWDSVFRDMRVKECANGLLAGRFFVDDLRNYVGGIDPGPGSVFYTPGFTNVGIPNFADSHVIGLPVGGLDGNGDGIQDVDWIDYSLNTKEGGVHLFPEFDRFSAMAYGEYTFTGPLRLTPFLEAQFNRRDVFSIAGEPQLFPLVPPDNPYNACNPNGLSGTDCALARNSLWAQQTVIDRFIVEYGVPPQAFGLGMNPPGGAMWARPIVRVQGDRNPADSTVEQTRIVAGLRGKLPGFGRDTLDDWDFEVTIVSANSSGSSSRPGIREDWLDMSLATSVVDPNTGNVVCGVDANGNGIPDGVNADGRACVPVNLWAPSLYQNIVGDFATQAERDYVFDSRDFHTEYDQWFVTALVSGDLFETPAGTVAAVFGLEYREDEINSIPDAVARDGLFFGFFNDGGAVGRKYTREAFGEVEVPVLEGKPGARELGLNVSGRYTEDQYFGSDTTYSIKLGWRPVDSLLVRGTTGTSFRAPNARENFLIGILGHFDITDPCAVPEGVIDPISGYNPDLETREPLVLQNCRDNGVDPTALDLGGNNRYRVEAETGGSTELVPETSRSWSYGFVWDQSLTEMFDLTLGVSRYQVRLANSIIEPTPQSLIDDCYGGAHFTSVPCSRITRDPAVGTIDFVSTKYLNRDELLVSGYDINLTYSQGISMFGLPVDLTLDIILNRPTEASQTFSDGQSNVDYDDAAGEWGFPDWQGISTLRADIHDFRFTWSMRYIGSVNQDAAEIDDWDDVFGIADTCLGPTQGDVLCRDVGFADAYFMHSASIYYIDETWTLGAGIRNIFDESPPLVNADEIGRAARNVPLGYGYDVNGRTFFLNVAGRFGRSGR